MNKSEREYAKIRTKVASWRQLRSRVNGIGRNFSIDTARVQVVIEEEILEAAKELDQFELFYYGDPDGPEGPFGLLKKLHQIPACLIYARAALGWTQSDLANRANLKHQQISRYENANYKNIGLANILLLAKILSEERRSWIGGRG